jgi:hypothetical protein
VSTPDPFEQDDADAAAMAAFFDWVNESEPTVAELRERISTLEALTDQLAEALRPCPCSGPEGYAALRAYEADKEAHR